MMNLDPFEPKPAQVLPTTTGLAAADNDVAVAVFADVTVVVVVVT